jgi:hypothetical protein
MTSMGRRQLTAAGFSSSVSDPQIDFPLENRKVAENEHGICTARMPGRCSTVIAGSTYF